MRLWRTLTGAGVAALIAAVGIGVGVYGDAGRTGPARSRCSAPLRLFPHANPRSRPVITLLLCYWSLNR